MPSCRATFTNRTPDYWQVKIVKIGAKFFYKTLDEKITHDWQTSKDVDLARNQTEWLDSNEPDSCVGAGFFVIAAQQKGKPVQILTKHQSGVPNECEKLFEISLTPEPPKGTQFATVEEALDARDFQLAPPASTPVPASWVPPTAAA